MKSKVFDVRISMVSEQPAFGKVESPEASLRYWKDVIEKESWFDPEKEQVVALILNTKCTVKAHSLVSLGTMNESIVHPRDVFRPAIAMGAYAVIVMHNHPSGDPAPSMTDHSLTRRLSEAGELLQIKILDHVIVGADRYFSFKEMGSV